MKNPPPRRGIFLLRLTRLFDELAAEGFLFEVIELGATNGHLLYQFNLCNVWRVEWEDLFHLPAFAVLQNTERAGSAGATSGKDGSFEDLNAFTFLSLWRKIFNFLEHLHNHSRSYIESLFLGHRNNDLSLRQRNGQ